MNLKHLLTKALLVVAMLGGGTNASWADATITWKAASTTPVTANSTLVSDDALTATSIYATSVNGDNQTINGVAFTHYIKVRNSDLPTVAEPNGTENSGSTSIVITPQYDGELTVYYRRQSTAQTDNKGTYNSNDGKDLKLYKQSDASLVEGTLTFSSEISDGKYGYFKKALNIEANTTYTLSASGTTIQFYGFEFTYDDGWTESWSRTFDDAYGITEFTGTSVETQNRSNSDATQVAAVFVGGGSSSTGFTFPSVTFTASDTYKFSFELALSSLNNNSSSRSEITFTSSESTQLFKLKSAGASGNKNILVYIGTSTDELSKDKTDAEYTANCLYASGTSGGNGTNNKPKASNWYTIEITADPTNGTWVTFTPQFTQAGYSTISKQISEDVVYIGSMSATVGQYYGCLWLDNFLLKQVVAADFIAAPGYQITAPDGTNRKFELSCSTDGATIYWATSELAKGAAGWTAYASEAVSTAATTIYAYAAKGENTSEIISFETGAGTIVDLLAATVTHTAANAYTISNDQSSLLGSPTATVHYQIDGGAEQTSTSTSVVVPVTANGTLTYWLTADGYGSTSAVNATVYAEVAYAKTTTLNFCTSNSTVWAYSDKNDETYKSAGEVTTDDTSRTYYKYVDESGNVVGDGLLAVSAQNSGSSWRIQRYYGGTQPYGKTEYVAVLDLKAGQVVQVVCGSEPGVVSSNISAITASSYTGNYSYLVNTDGDAIVSLAKGNTLKYIYICSSTVSATIGTTGWTTFASSSALDLSGMTASSGSVTAYYASAVGNNKVTMTSTDATVPAGEGIMLKGTAGATITIPVAVSGTSISGNKLVGVTSETIITSETTNYANFYVLSNNNGKAEFQNLKDYLDAGKSVTINAGKAYLDATTASGSRLSIVFDDDVPTGIADMEEVRDVENDNVYTLSGQRISKPTKGMFIVNGKKVLVK